MLPLSEKFEWYVNRLRCMSLAEGAYRLKASVTSRLQQHGILTAESVPAPDLKKHGARWLAGTRNVDVNSVCMRAEKILSGDVAVFAIDNARLGRTPRWNRDPLTGTEANLVFGKKIDVQNHALVGDIKYLWEINRHLHLVTVAQAYYLTEDFRYLNGLAVQIESWLEQCPYPLGPNWSSALESGIRLINWSIIWQLIGGNESKMFDSPSRLDLRDRWLRSVYQHCHFIDSGWSRHSSANNHLIGEAAGLFIASVTWPLWGKKTADWTDVAHGVLEKEALKQNAPDGVNREQAVSYQQFVLDFMLLSWLAAKAAGRIFPAEYWGRTESMLVYIASIMDVAGHVPMIGDSDDGFVVELGSHNHNPYKSLLATGGILFRRSDFISKAGEIDEKTRWLLGDQLVDSMPENHTVTSPDIQRWFPEGGYYILGTDLETDNEIKCLVDAGPVGYLSIAAHGHADALSLTLSTGGREILIDPGTYVYHGKDKWRHYFRGTSAHNTVRVNGQNQSASGGKFMWVRKAKVQCEKWIDNEDTAELTASHDGYSRSGNSVTHKRSVRLAKRNRRLRVTDLLHGEKEYLTERCWHFSEECRVTLTGESDILVINGAEKIRIHLGCTRSRTIKLYRGSEDPAFGWISRRYDIKVPATTIVESVTASGDVEFIADFLVLDSGLELMEC